MPITLSLSGKVALITGGSRGIGAAAVRMFVATGARVMFNYEKSKTQSERLVKELGQKNWGKRTVRPSTAIFPALEQRKNWSKLPLSVLGGLIFWSRTTEYGLRKMLPLRRCPTRNGAAPSLSISTACSR